MFCSLGAQTTRQCLNKVTHSQFRRVINFFLCPTSRIKIARAQIVTSSRAVERLVGLNAQALKIKIWNLLPQSGFYVVKSAFTAGQFTAACALSYHIVLECGLRRSPLFALHSGGACCCHAHLRNTRALSLCFPR